MGNLSGTTEPLRLKLRIQSPANVDVLSEVWDPSKTGLNSPDGLFYPLPVPRRHPPHQLLSCIGHVLFLNVVCLTFVFYIGLGGLILILSLFILSRTPSQYVVNWPSVRCTLYTMNTLVIRVTLNAVQ